VLLEDVDDRGSSEEEEKKKSLDKGEGRSTDG